jgi:hypothetical protein
MLPHSGIIIMVADNDAGGITTYTATGAQFDFHPIWFLILLGPVAYNVQETTVTLEAVTKRSHAEAISHALLPRAGFDKWVGFRGQGAYLPSANGRNVDGKHVPQKGYITDELTDYALDWLNTIPRDQPYFLYRSHKAVHADFIPAERHKGVYAKETFQPPKTMAESGPNEQHRPMWVQNQRNSWHGVDFPYHCRCRKGP